MSNANFEAADDLVKKLLTIINRCDNERTRLLAAMMLVGECIGCLKNMDRRNVAKGIAEELLPSLIELAMKRPMPH